MFKKKNKEIKNGDVVKNYCYY